MLSDKHIRAWDRFLDSKTDLCIIFEDDAIIPEKNYKKFLTVINKIFQYNDSSSLYADLAGGFPLEALGINKLFKKIDDGVIHFSKPVTNTTCSYIVNKKMVEKFKEIILLTPILRFIPADWMLNKLFIELDRLGSEVSCFHTYPSVFLHGSFAKIWKSTIDSND
jgi:GR25 family glycosyltransferase involved in LPS biosynthesis